MFKVALSFEKVKTIFLLLFYFITFANLILNQNTPTENKDLSDTIQAGTPEQVAPINAGPDAKTTKSLQKDPSLDK